MIDYTVYVYGMKFTFINKKFRSTTLLALVQRQKRMKISKRISLRKKKDSKILFYLDLNQLGSRVKILFDNKSRMLCIGF